MNFPISPTLNQTYTLGSKTWVWNGSAWDLQVVSATFNSIAPSQTGNSGKFLTTDGTDSSWATIVTGGGPITQNADVITTNQTIASGSNALSVGPMTINTGVTVTVATGQTYVVL
jgi:hypothetical protein